MDKKRLATYCGLYCGLCGLRTRIPERSLCFDAVNARGRIWTLGVLYFPDSMSSGRSSKTYRP